jgi:saccharopine dehydrogenase (NAD+, L-lysine-forming)
MLLALFELRFCVIGAGGVGQVIVRHLAKVAAVKVGDIDRESLREVAKMSGEVTTLKLNAGSPEQVRRFIKGSDVVINASNPRFNLLIMKQALKGGTHYMDLAGDTPSSEKEQMKQSPKWRKAGLVAVLEIGEDPGLSNILARQAADTLDVLREVRIRDGETSTSQAYPFVCLFAPEVFLEEVISPARYYENGEMKTSPPLSGREVYKFPPPLGEVPLYGMSHEEVNSLPKFLPKKPNFVDFKLALTDETLSAIKLFRDIGLLNRTPIAVGEINISPLSVLVRLLPPPSKIGGKIHGSAGIMVEVKGEISGQPYVEKLYTMMTHEEAFEKYQTNATSYLTGTPTAVCAKMLGDGCIDERGVIFPEMLKPQPFIEEAKNFGLQVHIEKLRVQQ